MKSPSLLQERARGLRQNQTEAERKLWTYLRNRQLIGVKFRRQHFIAPFIVDFCCPEHWLVIEIDGGQHAERVEADLKRTAFLTAQGYRVVRFWNNEVLTNIEGVAERLFSIFSDPHPDPLPGREREA